MDGGNAMDVQPIKDASGPPDGYAPSSAAQYFCQGFQQLCGFNKMGYYKDMLSCEWAYDSYSMSTELCVGNALGAMDCPGAACTGSTCMPCN
jgi:hypothetical protein